MAKAEGAFRTIGELAGEIGRPQHILRYWETKFPQLRPLTRAGRRRYYRPDDVALVRRIHSLLECEGYTIRGVQRLLASEQPVQPVQPAITASTDTGDLQAIRDTLAQALGNDRPA